MIELEVVRKLRDDGATSEYLAAARELAEANPTAVEAQIEAAYACDRFGSEADAIGYYDKAWALGVPNEERMRFTVGYGSTLRNVGRTPESIERLEAAAAAHPRYPPFKAFLALALHESGRSDEAMAILLGLIVEDATDLDGYDRALRHYAAALSSQR